YCRLTSVFLYSDPAPTESYALSLHDALPIFVDDVAGVHDRVDRVLQGADVAHHPADALGAVLTAVQMGVADMGENEHRSSGGRIGYGGLARTRAMIAGGVRHRDAIGPAVVGPADAASLLGDRARPVGAPVGVVGAA